MKKLILEVILLWFLPNLLYPQPDKYELLESATRYLLSNPADQVFLHLDRNRYYPNDTIRFQAYIRDRQTGIFETRSISLYTLLVNSASSTIDSARFRISGSTSSGWLHIPENISSGEYRVIAFTGAMMNYAPEFVFSAAIRIEPLRTLKSTVKKDSINQKYTADQVNLGASDIDLRFLPEGGTFIYGIKQRVVFNAVSNFGKSLAVQGQILNRKGIKICDFSSEVTGPGVFEITPVIGDTCYAVLNGEEFTGLKWQLPVPSESGVSMRSNNIEKGLIEIIISGKEVRGSVYHLSMIMNSITVFHTEFKIDSIYKIKIKTDELPIGTAYISLFDKNLSPIAERLIFVNGHRRLNINVETEKPVYKIGEETELIINTTDYEGKNTSSVISVAVIDSASGFDSSYPINDIGSSFLFDKDFYNNLPSSIKLKGLNNFGSESIDLLLMTFGWRKYNLIENADTIQKIRPINYDNLRISNSGTQEKGRKSFRIVTIESPKVFTLIPDMNGSTILPFDLLYQSVRQIMLMPDKVPGKNNNIIKIEFPENKEYTTGAKLLGQFYQELPANIILQKPKKDYHLPDSTIMIDPVNITGAEKPLKASYNNYQSIYNYARTSVLTKKEIASCFSFEDILQRLMPYYIDKKNKKIYLLPNRFGRSAPIPTMIVVDNIPIWATGGSRLESGYETISSLPPSQISSVSALKGSQGYTVFGQEAIGGVIFITTKAFETHEEKLNATEPAEKTGSNETMKPVRLFRSEVEFYIPTKEQVAFIPEYQSRSTILWKNEVILDGTGPVKIKFPNNITKGTAIVFISGVTFTNNPGSGSFKYIIR